MGKSLLTPFLSALSLILLITGCSIKQDFGKFHEPLPHQLCIVEHKEVKKGVLDALQTGFANHSVQTKVVKGNYTLSGSRWFPQWSPEEVNHCDALCFYVANWTWDITIYMHFANIWITTNDGKKRIAYAKYDASMGGMRLDKFINANDKILQMVDSMFTKTSQTHQKKSVKGRTDASTKDEAKLEKIKELYKNGLITEEEYNKEKREAYNLK